jgi:protein associated with RNAse G/E
LLGDDEAGTWLALPPGRPVYRGSEVLFIAEDGGVVLVPRGQWWMAWFPSGGPFQLYVDIVTPPSRADDTITMIDLDLDVVRWREGDVEVLDELEFQEHRVSFGYPEDLIAGAQQASVEVFEQVRAGEPPFVEPPARWRDVFEQLKLRGGG